MPVMAAGVWRVVGGSDRAGIGTGRCEAWNIEEDETERSSRVDSIPALLPDLGCKGSVPTLSWWPGVTAAMTFCVNGPGLLSLVAVTACLEAC